MGRALIAAVGWPANIPEDAVYPVAQVDADGKKLNGANKYTVSMRDKPTFNDDGSLTLYFQNESPGKEKEANWLPSPKGDFILTMRLYWPKEGKPSILPPGKGSWSPPAVVKAK